MAEDAGGQIIVDNELLASGFVQVPVVVMRDPDLSAGAKLAYGALLWYHWRGKGYPGQDAMGEDFGMGRRSVIRYMGELETKGYVVVTRPRLGKRNTYTLPDLSSECQPGTRTSANLALPKCQSGTSLVVEQDSTNPDSLSQASELAEAFFAAIGEARPSKRRRERAVAVVNDLTAEGFTPAAIAEACRLAGERGARGPDLLPHLIGEAHAAVEARAKAGERRATVEAATRAADLSDAEAMAADLAAVKALPVAKRRKLEADCRATLPPTVSDRMAEAVLPGMMAAQLRQRGDKSRRK